ncbi:MAG: hypothetical protein ACFCU9_11635 [Cyanophyceae cyanobacterium]
MSNWSQQSYPTANQALAISNVYAAQLANFATSQSLKTFGLSHMFSMT